MFTVYDPELPIKQIDIFLSKENSYQQLISSTVSVEIGGRTISLVTVAKLIEMKKAAGREKDIIDIAELERLMNC
jgi:predicted nucleotidyltransferase